MKEADEQIDQVVASTLQISEVQSGYRVRFLLLLLSRLERERLTRNICEQHSSDNASRLRVRSALNTSLKMLPEWPEPLYTGPTPPSQQPSQPQPQAIGYQPTGYAQPQPNASFQYAQTTGYPQQPSLYSQPTGYMPSQQQQQQQQQAQPYGGQPSYGYPSRFAFKSSINLEYAADLFVRQLESDLR